MSRKFYIGALLAAALLARPLPAQTSATVDHVVVRGTGDALEVEIQTSGATVSPNTQTLAGPDRIVVDFPGAEPSAELHTLAVNRGALRGVRSGLFFKDPPITRIVLDLTHAQAYRISTANNTVVVKLAAADLESKAAASAPPAFSPQPKSETAQLHEAAIVPGSHPAPAKLVPASAARISALTPANTSPAPRAAAITPAPSAASAAANPASANQSAPADPAVLAALSPAEPSQPAVTVSYENGMLSIHAEKATLSQVLYEVQTRTHAEIAIPAGAEQERVVADLGPGPARDVLGALLNGSPYNFIFVGNELSLERVILTRRETVF